MKAALCISAAGAVLVAFFAYGRPALAQAGENVLDLPPIEELTATRERPLFAVSRRPPAVVVAQSPIEKARPSIKLPFELTGIIVGEHVRMALLHDKSTNEDIKVAPGAVTGDWKVESVADRFVILSASDRRVRLWLIDFNPPPGVSLKAVGQSASAEGAVPEADGAVEEISPAPATPPAAHGEVPEGIRPVGRLPARVVRARPAPRPKTQQP